jgi:hypothetical protein
MRLPIPPSRKAQGSRKRCEARPSTTQAHISISASSPPPHQIPFQPHPISPSSITAISASSATPFSFFIFALLFIRRAGIALPRSRGSALILLSTESASHPISLLFCRSRYYLSVDHHCMICHEGFLPPPSPILAGNPSQPRPSAQTVPRHGSPSQKGPGCLSTAG